MPKKYKNFESLGLFFQTPVPPAGGDSLSRRVTAPLLQIFGFAPDQKYANKFARGQEHLS